MVEALPKQYQTQTIDSIEFPGVGFTIKPLTKCQRIFIASSCVTEKGHTIVAMAGLESVRFSLKSVDGLMKPGSDSEPFALDFETTRLSNRKTQAVKLESLDALPDLLFNEIGKAISEGGTQLRPEDRESLDPSSTSDDSP